MIIYCAAFSLGSNLPLHAIAVATCAWINRKTGSKLTSEDIKNSAYINLAPGSFLRAWSTADGDYPQALALEYTHPDQDIRGRMWSTQIGARRHASGNPLDVSILLRTEEKSTQVKVLPKLSVPRIIIDLLQSGNPVPGSPGLQVYHIEDSEGLHRVQDLITHPGRKDPVFLISCSPNSGKPLVDPDRLLGKVQGLADVVVYSSMFARDIAGIVGFNASPRQGAISVIWTNQNRTDPDHYFHTFFGADDVGLMGSGLEETPEEQLLAYLTQRTNWINERRHITPEAVQSLVFSAELSKIQSKAKESIDYIGLAESALQRVTEIEKELARLRDQSVEAMELKTFELEDKDKEIEGLKRRLASTDEALLAAQVSLGHDRPKNDPLGILRTIVGKHLPPRKMLEVLVVLFPDHVLALDSAIESAEEAEQFRYPAQLWEGLWLFATDYWEALAHGTQGDAEAKKILGKAHYSANESETTTSTQKTASQRTFRYNGEDVLMERHLKYGTNNKSPNEGIRVHFLWDSEKKLLVIGHCGRHLDTKTGD